MLLKKSNSWIGYIFFSCFLLLSCSQQVGDRESIVYREENQASYASSSKKRVLKTLIILDAGHGGSDRGTESKDSIPLQEKVLTLETAKLVQVYLKQMGYETRMTREKDVFIPLRKRVEMANRMNACLFVSIHFNSASNSAIWGAEVFYYKNLREKEKTAQSKKLADFILLQLKEMMPTKTRGVKHGNFCVIRETKMPAVLVEAAFLSNPREAKLLNTRVYKQRIARAIALGIEQFLVSHA